MRQQVDLDHAALTRGQRLFAHVFHGLAAVHGLHLGLDQPPGFLTDDLAHGMPQDVLRRPAVVLSVALVGEAAAQGGDFVVRHQGRNGVGHQPQQGSWRTRTTAIFRERLNHNHLLQERKVRDLPGTGRARRCHYPALSDKF